MTPRELLPLADALLALSQAVHGGTLVTFALLLGFRGLTGPLGTVGVARAFRACGATLGTSLGLFILAALYRWPFAVHPGAPWPDAYAVPTDDPLTVARVVVFVAYWVSYVWLEIWTLDGIRDLDKEGVIVDAAAYEGGAARAARHLGVNALLFAAIIVLGALGGAP
jgi:hypothetical protein